MDEDSVIQAIDVDTIYAVPKDLKTNGLDVVVLNALGKNTFPKSNLRKWNKVVERIRKPIGEVTIGVVGKYLDLNDAYKSLFEALTHGGISNNVKVNIKNIDVDKLEKNKNKTVFNGLSGILVPGGFGKGDQRENFLHQNMQEKIRYLFLGFALVCKWQLLMLQEIY